MSDSKLPHLFSYSQLGMYRSCSQRYKLYYVDGNKRKETSQAAEIGSLVHECIEQFYLGNFPSPGVAFTSVMGDYLTKLNLLNTYHPTS